MPRAWPDPLMLRGYGYEMDQHNDARTGPRRATRQKPAWRQSTPLRSSAAQSHRLTPIRHVGKPQSLRRIAARFAPVHGARPISTVGASIGGAHGAHVPAPGVDRAAHVVASEGLLGP